jgi:hypothetical protein
LSEESELITLLGAAAWPLAARAAGVFLALHNHLTALLARDRKRWWPLLRSRSPNLENKSSIACGDGVK